MHHTVCEMEGFQMSGTEIVRDKVMGGLADVLVVLIRVHVSYGQGPAADVPAKGGTPIRQRVNASPLEPSHR